jgi:hypothetical protein
LKRITALAIAISTLTLGLGVAKATQAPEPHPTHHTRIEYPRHLREHVVQLAEIIPAGVPKDPTKRCPEWEDKFREYGLPAKTFSYIAYRESRCNPKAHNTTLNRNKTQDLGLVQVNSSWKTVTRNICGTDITGLFDVDCNLKVAKYLFDNGGLGHWSL